MKLLVFVVGALVATVLAEKTEDLLKSQGKRQSNEKQNSGQLSQTALKYLAQSQKSAAQNYNLQGLSYDPQSVAYPQQALQYSAQSAAAPHLTFGFSPQPQQHQQQQQQIQYVSQPVAYEQPKAAPAPVQKLAPIHFSPASEVSSFKFTSPLVTYSNQGVLSQLVGNAPEIVTGQHAGRQGPAAPSASHYAAAPQKSAPQQQYQQYSEEDYSSAPQKVSYSQAPQQYEYVQVPQQLAYSAQPQKLTYSQSASAQPSQSQYLYDQGPQQFGSANTNGQQVVYSSAQSQNAHLAPSQQQFVYSYTSPQASQTNSRPVYAVPQYRTSQSAKHGSTQYYSQ